MANLSVSYNWMMDNEDAERKYAVVADPVPVRDSDSAGVVFNKKSAFAISGINSFYYPDEFAAIAALPQEARGEGVMNFYATKFWNVWFQSINDPEVCKRMFDCAVNPGPGLAVSFAQTAINSIGISHIDTDGKWGPITVAAINAASSGLLIPAFQSRRLSYYQRLVIRNPSLSKFLGTADNPGAWWKRAMK